MKSLLGSCVAALTMMLFVQSIVNAQSAPATPRSLSLVLLVGEMTGPPVSDDVPMSARKALDELRGFLPFKSYRLYDTGLIGMPSRTLPAVARLRGASSKGQDPQLFEVSVVRPTTSSSLDVSLREVGQSDAAKPAPAPAATASSPANLMAASVQLSAGETVVVGASRVRGDKALVLLITAMPSAPGASARPLPPPISVVPAQPVQPAQPARPGTPFYRDGVQPPQPPQPSMQPPQPPTQPTPAPLPSPPARPQSTPPPLSFVPGAAAAPPAAATPAAPTPPATSRPQ